MKRLLYTPFAIVFGVLGSRLGRRVFRALWTSISDDPAPPSPREPELSLAGVALSAALEGATVAATAAVARQLSVRAFHHLFGVWPVKPGRQPAGDPA